MGRVESDCAPLKPVVLMSMNLSSCDVGTMRVETSPQTTQLCETINTVFDAALDAYGSVPQISPLNESIQDRLLRDNRDMISRVRSSVTNSVKDIAEDLMRFAARWEERYFHLWRENAVDVSDNSAIEARIHRVQESMEDVRSEEHTHVLGFVRIECGYLKQSLLALAQNNVQGMISELRAKAATEIDDVMRYFEMSVARFEQPPSDINELVKHVSELKQLQTNVDSVPASFVKPRDSFRILNEFVDVTETESQRLASIDDKFEEFKFQLETIESSLDATKDVFQNELRTSIVQLEKDAREYKVKFDRLAPMQTHPACAKRACDKSWEFIAGVDEVIEQFDHRLRVILNLSLIHI